MRKKTFFALGAALLLTASCSNEENTQPSVAGEKVSFVLGGVATRTVTESDFTTKFVSGDRIGIYATGNADGNNELFEVLSDGTLTSESNIYYTSNSGTADFYAYYPYAQQNEQGVVRITVPDNQSTEESFNSADFMTAVQSGVTVNTQDIELKFRHQMALVQVEVSHDASIPVPDAIVLTAQRTCVWHFVEGTYGYEGETEEITMWKKGSSDASTLFWAMVPPQNVAPRTKLLTIRCGNDSYSFTTTSEVSFTANTIKKFNIKIGSDGKLVVFSNDIVCGEWENDGEEIEGEGTLIIPNTLMEMTDFDYFSSQEITKNKEQISGAGWWRFQLNADDAVEISTDEAFPDRGKVMHINRATVPGWHNGTYYYCVENVPVISDTYVLQFKARSSETENMKANQLRIGAYMQTATTDETTGKTTYTDYFAIIHNGTTDGQPNEVTTVYKQIITSEEYADYSVTFNLNKVSTVHNATVANVTEASKSVPTDEMLKKVVFYISSNAATVDFWIDDMRWIPSQSADE